MFNLVFIICKQWDKSTLYISAKLQLRCYIVINDDLQPWATIIFGALSDRYYSSACFPHDYFHLSLHTDAQTNLWAKYQARLAFCFSYMFHLYP